MSDPTSFREADYPVERSADLFLAAPAGQALLAIVEASSLELADLADPELATHLAQAAMDLINPWGARTPAILERLALDSPGRRLLADRLATAPELDGWFAPLDPRRPQLWSSHASIDDLSDADFDRATSGPMTSWEGYAHKPSPAITTSTTFGDNLSSLIVATALGMNDLQDPGNAPIRRRLLVVRPEIRVFEITGPASWAALSRSYPYLFRNTHQIPTSPDGVRHLPSEEELVPDWSAVARDWDGVHLSLGALLLSTDVPWIDGAGRSTFRGWDFEGTLWLRRVFDGEPQTVPDLDQTSLQMPPSGPADRITVPAALDLPALLKGDGAEAQRLRSSPAVSTGFRSSPGRLSPETIADLKRRLVETRGRRR